MRVLNVGGGKADMPTAYSAWDKVLLDINPDVEPDLCIDAKELLNYDDGRFDSIYCSHCLEHFYRHDVPSVLKGFLHVLNDDGFAEITVPNCKALLDAVRAGNLCLDDVWYRTGEGNPITFHDTLFGWGQALKNGNYYYAHKCGFTPTSLTKELVDAGFKSVWIAAAGPNIHAYAYKKEGVPCPQQ